MSSENSMERSLDMTSREMSTPFDYWLSERVSFNIPATLWNVADTGKKADPQ